ncbi:MAG: YbjN domain-containing protein [Alphaproteobacteria bacterium]|jgi:hypothetical protein|nr:YbjN domain-containing protein [Alphaproteobacteria bacterium]MDP6518025.1 YbjN domain-containing protein [Alphaproteobacteria bacterium]
METMTRDTMVSAPQPIDAIEEVATARDWAFERQDADEIAIQIGGSWCEYRLWFVWRSDLAALYFSCGFDMRVPKERQDAVYPLLAKLNERLWLGHFELWSDEGWPTFRHTLLVPDGVGVSGDILQHLVDDAVAECERFYPAFQWVIWGGKNADQAIEVSLLDTVGEA